jgi:hypothetical protein
MSHRWMRVTDLAEVIIGERRRLAAMLMRTAEARETAPEVADDLRYTVAPECIRQIAATLDLVRDDTLVRLANVNAASNGSGAIDLDTVVRPGLRTGPGRRRAAVPCARRGGG